MEDVRISETGRNRIEFVEEEGSKKEQKDSEEIRKNGESRKK